MILAFFLLLTLFICFFILYLLSKNDFVLLRKNISLQKMFDTAFLILIFSFVVGRFFYILDTFKFGLLHWLTFFHILKFPGISLTGAFLGAFLAFIFFREKSVLKRVADIFYLSFYPMIIFSFITANWSHLPLLRVGLVLCVVSLFGVLVRFYRSYAVHDGSITLIVLSLLAATTLISKIASSGGHILSVFSFSMVTSMLIFITSIILFYLNEKKILKKRKRL